MDKIDISGKRPTKLAKPLKIYATREEVKIDYNNKVITYHQAYKILSDPRNESIYMRNDQFDAFLEG